MSVMCVPPKWLIHALQGGPHPVERLTIEHAEALGSAQAAARGQDEQIVARHLPRLSLACQLMPGPCLFSYAQDVVVGSADRRAANERIAEL